MLKLFSNCYANRTINERNAIDRVFDAVSKDQKEINNFIAPIVLNKTILHVGVGTSSVAKRFHKQAKTICGITLSSKEKILADQLKIPNYQTVMLNKHKSQEFRQLGKFDMIIDNNINSYACCECHLYKYVYNLLSQGKLIVTHVHGTMWTANWCQFKWGVKELEGLKDRFNCSVKVISRVKYPIVIIIGHEYF